MGVLVKILLFLSIVIALVIGLKTAGSDTAIISQVAHIGTLFTMLKGNLMALQDMFPAIDLIAVFSAYLITETLVIVFKTTNYLSKSVK